MILVEEKIKSVTEAVPENVFFQVFLGFRYPKGISSYIEGSANNCGVFLTLAKIFNRPPKEINDSICGLIFGGREAFMQEYSTIEDASKAAANAFLFSHTTSCICFLKQEGFFYIKEIKK